MKLDKLTNPKLREFRPPCISYPEACEIAGVKSLSNLISRRDDAPKPRLIKHSSKTSGQVTWYSRPEMLSWLKKMREIGELK